MIFSKCRESLCSRSQLLKRLWKRMLKFLKSKYKKTFYFARHFWERSRICNKKPKDPFSSWEKSKNRFENSYKYNWTTKICSRHKMRHDRRQDFLPCFFMFPARATNKISNLRTRESNKNCPGLSKIKLIGTKTNFLYTWCAFKD